MDRYTIDNLPDGTIDKLTIRAKKKGVTYINGEPHLAKFIREVLIKESDKK